MRFIYIVTHQKFVVIKTSWRRLENPFVIFEKYSRSCLSFYFNLPLVILLIEKLKWCWTWFSKKFCEYK